MSTHFRSYQQLTTGSFLKLNISDMMALGHTDAILVGDKMNLVGTLLQETKQMKVFSLF